MRTRRTISRRVVTGLALLSLLTAASGHAQTSLVVNRLQVVSAAGTPAENCIALRAALAAIDDATEANPYTLRLEPGEYACGDETVTMKPFVDVEGSGEGVTRITGTRDSTVFGVLDLAGDAELRFVTVEALADVTRDRIAVSASVGSSRLVHVRLIAGDGTVLSARNVAQLFLVEVDRHRVGVVTIAWLAHESQRCADGQGRPGCFATVKLEACQRRLLD